MATTSSPFQKLFSVYLLFILLCGHQSCYGQNLPTQLFPQVNSCFQSYSYCNEEYRLTQSGEFHVPLEETESFCTGSCYRETELVLDCIDHSFSYFIFYNGANVQIIRNVLRNGCSNGVLRGNFNVGQFLFNGAFFGAADKLSNSIRFSTFGLLITGCYALIF